MIFKLLSQIILLSKLSTIFKVTGKFMSEKNYSNDAKEAEEPQLAFLFNFSHF